MRRGRTSFGGRPSSLILYASAPLVFNLPLQRLAALVSNEIRKSSGSGRRTGLFTLIIMHLF